MRVLLLIEQCNPQMSSVPQLGYRLYSALGDIAEVVLCTHGRNKEALQKKGVKGEVVYLDESKASAWYYKALEPIVGRGGGNWPLYHLMLYPIYEEFNRKAYSHFAGRVRGGEFDVVHAFTPVTPRYPVKLASACGGRVPFFLGPVNGGVPFPEGFEEVAKKEYAFLSPLRGLSRLLPGYKRTYLEAEKVWVGSQYTLKYLQDIFPEGRFELLSENGVDAKLLEVERSPQSSRCDLLYAGRLEPVKCVDLLLLALARLRKGLRLTVVGDGSERPRLEKMVEELGLKDFVDFKGWVAPQEVFEYYFKADIFCFPSIKDFGGAVVLEAMAAGLPIVAVNYGGVAEYADASCAYLVQPSDPDSVVEGFCEGISKLANDPSLRDAMGRSARKKALEYTWENKARSMLSAYEQALAGRHK